MLTPSQNIAYSLPQNEGGGELCMKGGIYSEQRCQICGSRFKDNRKNALICPEHQDQKANKLRVYFKCYHRSGTGPKPPFKMKPPVSKGAAQHVDSE